MPTAASEASASITDIVVTGSRIARTGMTAPTPVTIFSEKELVQAAPSTVSEALRTLPALTNTSGPQRNPGTISGGQSFLDLRSLGPSRTLTLVNGQRFATSPLTGSVDVNLIPAALIQRVEIVTGGASAAYGSDAVTGVVNFILDTRYSGVKADGYYGFSQVGDNREVKLQVAAGSDFAEGRGHIVIAGEYFDNAGARPEKRDWSTRGNNFIVGPSGGLIVASNVRTLGTYGGLIQNGNGGSAAANASFAGIQFLPGGTPAPYSFGSYRNGELQIGGDGINTELIQDITRPLTRKNAYGRVEFEVLPDTKVYAEALYGQGKSDYVNSYNRNRFGNQLTIRTDNAYLPQSLRTQAAAAGVTSFTVLRYSQEGGFVHTVNDAATQRYNVGANGKLGGWKWDVYYQHAFAKQSTDILNDQNATRYSLAVDAVVNPANGQIVCRSTLTNPTNGCVPLNIFGEGSPSPAALAYAIGASQAVSRLTQDVTAANISGNLLDGWAGPISLAAGAEWRRERASVTSDPLSIAGQYLFGNPQPWSGGYSAKEAYAEIVVPLLRDVPMAEDLELNVAGRLTGYSTSGKIWSWKAGLSYTPFAGLRLRATRSRDIRAPNSSELFNKGRTLTTTVADPFQGGGITGGVPLINKGNADLKPETTRTLTIGAVIQPVQVRGLSFSVDYYDIKVASAIQTITPQQLVDQCFAGNPLACAQTTRNSAGALTQIFGVPINLALLRATGIDAEATYRFDLGDIAGPDSRLSLRTLVSYLGHLQNTVPGSAVIDRAGEVGLSPTPHWSGNAQVTLASDALSVFLQGRLIGGGKYDITKTAAQVDLQHIKPQFYLDGQISLPFPPSHGKVELYVDVRNILNHEPPVAPGNNNIAIPTNAALYDLVGRNFRFGVRAKF